MASNPLETAINNLVDVMRSVRDGLKGSISGQSPVTGAATSPISPVTDILTRGLGLLVPQLRFFNVEIRRAAESLRRSRELSSTSRGMSSSSPLGPAGLRAILGVASDPNVRPQERAAIHDAVERARITQSYANRANRRSDAAEAVRSRAADAFRDARQNQVSARAELTRSQTDEATARNRYQAYGVRVNQARANLAAARANFAAAGTPANRSAVTAAQRNYRRVRSRRNVVKSRYKAARTASTRAAARFKSTTTKVKTSLGNYATARGAAQAAAARAAAARGTAQAAGSAAQALTARAAQAAAGRAALSAAGGAVGIAIGAVLGLAQAAVSAARNLKSFAETTNRGNLWMAQYSGRVAEAFQKLSLSGIRRDIGVTKYTEPTTIALTRSIDKMHDSWFQFDATMQDLNNRFAHGASQTVKGAGAPFGELTLAINNIAKGVGLGEENSGLSQWLENRGHDIANLITAPIMKPLNGIVSILNMFLPAGKKIDLGANPPNAMLNIEGPADEFARRMAFMFNTPGGGGALRGGFGAGLKPNEWGQ